MNSEEQRAKIKECNQTRQKLCKNNKVELVGKEIKIEGCENYHRHGSAYCQPCSDKYHGR
jgi:hypothetical protein